MGELFHVAHAFGRFDHFHQGILYFLVQAVDHGRAEQAGADGVDANAHCAQFTRCGHVQPQNTGLGRRVGALADLPFIGGAGRNVDHHAAFFTVFSLVACHCFGALGHHVEDADEIDVDHSGELFQRGRLGLPIQDLAWRRNAGAVDQHVNGAETGQDLRNGGADAGLVGDIGALKAAAFGAKPGDGRLTR